MVGISPNEASAIRLVRAILTDLRDDWQATNAATSPKTPWRPLCQIRVARR